MLEARKAQELLVKKISSCRTRGFLPPELLDLVQKIYTRQLEARDQAAAPAAGSVQTADALQHSQGAPLVERSRFPFDRDQAVALFHEFLGFLPSSIPALAEAADQAAGELAQWLQGMGR